MAVGRVHRIGGKMSVKFDRAEKLRNFPVPVDPTGIRSFNGAYGPCRRWIKNCAEIARPLNRLTGKVPWKWGSSEALSFTILREKAASAVDMHGVVHDEPCELYSDASGYGAGCVIIQVRQKVPYPILYDAFMFTRTQRNYGTFKRELFAIVEFCRRHRHFFSCREPSIIFTDHKPLTWFIDSANHEGIYARWVTELRCINVIIKYIEGKRNAAADGLSRTIFESPDCEHDPRVDNFGEIDRISGLWIWKDGAGGYDELLSKIEATRQGAHIPALEEYIRLRTSLQQSFEGLSQIRPVAANSLQLAWVWSDDFLNSLEARGEQTVRIASLGLSSPSSEPKDDLDAAHQPYSIAKFLKTKWYGQVARYLMTSEVRNPLNRHESRQIRDQAALYRFMENTLWKKTTMGWVRCLVEGEISTALDEAHDQMGHFGPNITCRRLNRAVFWPGMAKDIVRYIPGCLPCARHAANKPSSPNLPVKVSKPMEVVGIDHVGPFPTSDRRSRYLLVIVDYFSRYVWMLPSRTTTAPEAVNLVRLWLSWVLTVPVGMYANPGSSFRAVEFRVEMNREGIEVLNAPAQAHRSVGMVQVTNKILQLVLNKTHSTPLSWDHNLSGVMKAMNGRVVQALGFSPFEIMMGLRLRSRLEFHNRVWDSVG